MERVLFETAKIPYAYLKLALPVVLAMVLNVVYNMVDTWFISLTGDPPGAVLSAEKKIRYNVD